MPNNNERQAILPEKGLWTVEGLAQYLGMTGSQLTQKLTDKGIKILSLSNRSKHKLINLEDLKPTKEGIGNG